MLKRKEIIPPAAESARKNLRINTKDYKLVGLRAPQVRLRVPVTFKEQPK